MMVIPSLIREDMRNTFQETMVKEMVKSPVSDAVWAHPRIFSGFRDDHAPHGMGIQSLV
jgi:hypothetical protein